MSDDTPERPTDSILRITKDEALSAHVDDLLKRQASLRGERGISANRRRRWYYSNCFVFAIAGFVGAIVAAAILEPHFHDTLPFRGTVTQIEPMPDGIGYLPVGNGQSIELLAGAHAVGSVTVAGDELWFTDLTREIVEDNTSVPFDFESLKPGTDVVFYVEYLAEEDVEVAIVRFVDLTPTGNFPVGQSLRQLNAAQTAVGLLLFPVVAALTGLAIGAADGIVCRLWRRVFVAGIVGLLIGFLGGFVSQFLAGIVYLPLNNLAMEQQTEGIGQLTTLGFLTQVTGRGLAWCLAGMAMGLGQGVAMRSGRLLLYGFLGGAIGGLLGGLLFDPIDLLLLGTDKPSAHLSRFIGLATIGIVVGAMIGIVELLARDAWLQMVQGPLAGKEFLIFKDSIQIGASPRSDIYLFNDAEVAPRHATIRAAADHYELEATDRQQHPVLVNGRPIQRTRLRHGDQITLGRTVFAFQKRRKDSAMSQDVNPTAALPVQSSVCVVCQSALDAATVTCPACSAKYHQECWEYNGGCGVYGCEQTPETEGLSSLEIPASHWGREDKVCPSCGETILAAAVRCRKCGATFSNATPQDSLSYRLDREVNAELPALRTTGIVLLVFAMIPCTAPFAAVIGAVWYLSKAKAIRKLPAMIGAMCKIAIGVAWLQTLMLGGIMFLKNWLD